MTTSDRFSTAAAAGALGAILALPACAPPPEEPAAAPYPLIASGQTQQLSDHAYTILDNNVSFVPNVGIVVGERATLIIDSGLGERNGQVVLEEARKLSSNELFYVTATHFHSEHELGASAFPDNARIIRSRAVQREIDELGSAHITRFRGFSPDVAELLEGAEYRDADILFDSEYVLYLGGVNVRMMHVGPAHTGGDTAFFVEGDNVLFAGDVAMRNFPGIRGAEYNIAGWREALARIAPLGAQTVVPSHGPLGDATLISAYDDLFATLQTRTRELKSQGRSADEAAEVLMAELGSNYPDWDAGDLPLLGNAARVAYAEAP